MMLNIARIAGMNTKGKQHEYEKPNRCASCEQVPAMTPHVRETRGGARFYDHQPKNARWGKTKPITLRLPLALIQAVDESVRHIPNMRRTDAIVAAIEAWVDKGGEQA